MRLTTKQETVLAEAIDFLGIGDVYTWEHLGGNCKPQRVYSWLFPVWEIRFINENGDVLTVSWDGGTGRTKRRIAWSRKVGAGAQVIEQEIVG